MTKMTEKEINDYLNAVLAGDLPITTLLETEALNQFRSASEEANKAAQRITKIFEEAESLRAAAHCANGRCDAYAQILVTAEQQRRIENLDNLDKLPDLESKLPGAKATEIQSPELEQPLSLSQLADKLGADEIAAVDNEGNIISKVEKIMRNVGD